MARSFSLIVAIVMFFYSHGTADFDSSNYNINDLTNLLKAEDIVIDTIYDYLQEQEIRLATLRKHIENYTKEHDKAIQKTVRTLRAATQKRPVNNVKETNEMKEEADEGDLSHLNKYAGTNYEKLCNGEILPPADIQKKCKCRYVDHGNPFLKIAPFKEEEVYLDPKIVVYHDVIYEEEIEDLKRSSRPKLHSAQLLNSTSGQLGTSKQRIAKCAWFEDDENKHVKILSRRVAHMTGLTVDTAEQLGVTYYEIGGLYEPHYDFATKSNINFFNFDTGNRIATILFYMNDVEKGGGTAFTELNFTLWPKKGSAAVWYNLKRNGEGDVLTKHAACPVLSGTKWIANKWLHEKGQELLRPCTLSENE
ncbi:prolyl 4-hydroxylase subunit alpha-2 [Belonocnema kinseyi]|uniref:prolyl 4-hydroxylase subunit alpha-2 n=1 Tax=Belonocnema kinseyi TaxID=2817044 RepID=UPI00143DCEE1|nr:prolyl 4-hydroxylase subunit alpha-2 [Belonocnema kinseyi]XP_033213459.1 prolyl 4-hydroxylase subunit alpha-2 [Belonocnema kinseyi]XP_033213467.1 prolyl 4-hydroxylase subunit alpha-2 [Belonocnema kinseyi]